VSDFKDSLTALPTHDPLKELRETMKAIQMHDPMKEIRESMKAMQLYDPMNEIRESMKAMQLYDPMNEIRESIKAMQMHDPMKEVRDLIRALSDNRWVLDFEDESNIHLNADGMVSLGSSSISQKELQILVHQVISAAFDERSNQIDYKFDKLIEQISSLKDPFLQKLLSWLIYPLIVGLVLSVVSPVNDFYIKKALNSNEKMLVVKEVSATVSNTVPDTFLSSFRIVTADMLYVRNSDSSRSPVLGILYFGDVVEVVEKGRTWSLVGWHDSENNVMLKGWVFSRYLKNIR
jgi:cell fate (sporulation/competence/biofilm development) regulator YlbF (YheA/YmcA/DUF963 family)